jgi:hypothetical protein
VITEKGKPGELQITIKDRDKLNKSYQETSGLIDKVVTTTLKETGSRDAATKVYDAYMISAQKGRTELASLAATGDISKASFLRMLPVLNQLALSYSGIGGSMLAAGTKLDAFTDDINAQKQAMIAAASEAGLALATLPDNVIANWNSKKPEFQEVGVQAFAAYLTGVSQGTISTEVAGKIAQQMFDTGTFVATGNAAVDAALKSMADKVQASKYLKQFIDVMNVFGEKPKEASIKISDGGTARSTVKSLAQVEDKANKLAGVKPNIRVSGGDQPASSRLTSFVTRARALNGKTLASVNILATILTKSTPREWDHADEAGAYLAREIAAGGNAAGASINVGAGFSGGAGAAMAGGGLQGYIDKLKTAWDALNKTALVGWSHDTEVALGRFGDMENAIADLGQELAGPQLEAWRNMRGAYDEAQTAMKDFDGAIKIHQGILDGLNDTLEAQQVDLRGLQDELEGYQASLDAASKLVNKFSSARLAPVEAREDESFGMQHRLDEINLAILKAQRARDFPLLRQLSIEKKRLEKEKEIYDLQTKVDLDPQLHAIEKMKEARSSEAMSFDQIVGGLKDAWAQEDLWNGKVEEVNKKIIEKNRMIRDIGDQIKGEQDTLKGIQAEYDKASVAVATYSAQIEEMAKNFLSRYDQMIAAQQKLNEEMASSPNLSMLTYQKQTDTMAQDFLAHYRDMIAAQGDLNRSMAMGGTGARAVDMSKVLVGAGVSQIATTDKSTTTVINQHFDKLILPNVTDYKSLKRDLGRDAKLRMAVPS